MLAVADAPPESGMLNARLPVCWPLNVSRQNPRVALTVTGWTSEYGATRTDPPMPPIENRLFRAVCTLAGVSLKGMAGVVEVIVPLVYDIVNVAGLSVTDWVSLYCPATPACCLTTAP